LESDLDRDWEKREGQERWVGGRETRKNNGGALHRTGCGESDEINKLSGTYNQNEWRVRTVGGGMIWGGGSNSSGANNVKENSKGRKGGVKTNNGLDLKGNLDFIRAAIMQPANKSLGP